MPKNTCGSRFITTFNLPNFNDKVIQGNNRGIKNAGLPNITAKTKMYSGAVGMNFQEPTGAFTIGEVWATGASLGYAATPGPLYYAQFNANNSNAIYGSSDTVQPKACLCNMIVKY